MNKFKNKCLSTEVDLTQRNQTNKKHERTTFD